MEFDTTTLLVYTSNPDSPTYSDEQLDDIQAGHMAHLQSLGERGLALTADPLVNRVMRAFEDVSFSRSSRPRPCDWHRMIRQLSGVGYSPT